MALQTLPNEKLGGGWKEIALGAQEVLLQCLSASTAVLVAVGTEAPAAGDTRGHLLAPVGSRNSILSLSDLAGAKVFVRASGADAELAITVRL